MRLFTGTVEFVGHPLTQEDDAVFFLPREQVLEDFISNNGPLCKVCADRMRNEP